MKRTLSWSLAGLLLAAWPAMAQPQPGPDKLPISRIVLFSSGVGYFQRDGLVEGDARINLQFQAQNINDLLKSLVVQDAGGGRVSTVSYDSRDPIEKTLKSFAIDLTSNPSQGQLLQQIRGERIEVMPSPDRGSTPIVGTIVGVQKIKKPIGKDHVIDVEQLDLLTEAGLQSITLDQVMRIKILKPELEQEFRKALEVLATAHDKQKKAVSLTFLGNGKRQVRVGYVTESPIWKTSYRLALGKEKDKVMLQGWAIVENTTDDDWKDVSLGLISGRPISFQMNLYEPLYVKRPVVEPELFASLRPPSYTGDMMSRDRRLAEMKKEDSSTASNRAPAAQPMPAPAPAFGGMGGLGRRAAPFSGTSPKGSPTPDDDPGAGVVSAAVATELGEYFQYQIEQPVSLARQKSALIPIVNSPVEAARVSIYNEGVHAKFPLHGLRLKNTTGLHLMQGPITILEGNSYAGDARISDLQPKETRLVSYAIDLGTEVVAEDKPGLDNLVAVKVTKGILEATHKQRTTKLYTVKNRSEHERLVLLEHPIRSEWNLTKPEKPAERARDVYRFELKAPSFKTVEQEVIEEHTSRNEIVLTNAQDDDVIVYLRARVVSPKVKEALQRAVELKGKWAATQQEIRTQEQALKVIEQDQARMRANMERVPQTSEAYKRYLKKFDDQETEIEKTRMRIVKLQAQAEEQRQAYEGFVSNLTVE